MFPPPFPCRFSEGVDGSCFANDNLSKASVSLSSLSVFSEGSISVSRQFHGRSADAGLLSNENTILNRTPFEPVRDTFVVLLRASRRRLAWWHTVQSQSIPLARTL